MIDSHRFITIEGIEGTGKSTLLKTIEGCFEKMGEPVLMTREPGGTPVAEAIRHIVLGEWEDEPVCDEVELMLIFAGRKQHVERLIMPQLKANKWVVSDRFVDASYAYQGAGRGIGMEMVDRLAKWLLGDFKPNLTLLLDCPVDVALSRIAHRGKDRIEHEKAAFFERVRQQYLAMAKAEPNRFVVVDVNRDLDTICRDVEGIIRAYIEAAK